MEEGIHVAISAEKLGEFFGIPITNTLVTSWVVIALPRHRRIRRIEAPADGPEQIPDASRRNVQLCVQLCGGDARKQGHGAEILSAPS